MLDRILRTPQLPCWTPGIGNTFPTQDTAWPPQAFTHLATETLLQSYWFPSVNIVKAAVQEWLQEQCLLLPKLGKCHHTERKMADQACQLGGKINNWCSSITICLSPLTSIHLEQIVILVSNFPLFVIYTFQALQHIVGRFCICITGFKKNSSFIGLSKLKFVDKRCFSCDSNK